MDVWGLWIERAGIPLMIQSDDVHSKDANGHRVQRIRDSSVVA